VEPMAAFGRPSTKGTAMSLATSRASRASRDAAFDALFSEYAGPIYNYVLRMLGDADRAKDVTQDTFIKAFRRLDTLGDPAATRAWVYRIASNTAIDELRRRRFVTPMGADAEAYDRADLRPGPEEEVVARTLDHRLQRALLRLRANQRQCLVLSDLQDMSAQQIGEVMGMSNGAVRTLLCRARGEMRRELAREGIGT
jgi:RNA polymerase sigma-70 factor, ECF subfamily